MAVSLNNSEGCKSKNPREIHRVDPPAVLPTNNTATSSNTFSPSIQGDSHTRSR